MKQAQKPPPDAYNSESLRARFPEVYEKFFSEQDVVVSAPFIYCFSGNIAGRVGGLMIQSRMPFRAYFGISSNSSKNTISFGSALTFSQLDQKFKSVDYELLNWPATVDLLKQYLREALQNTVTPGLTISFLLEFTHKAGFAVELWETLLTATNLYCGTLKPDMLQEVLKLNADEIIELKTPASKKYHEIRHAAMRLIARTLSGAIPGALPAHTLRGDSSFPFVYFIEDRVLPSSPLLNDTAPRDLYDDPHYLDTLHTWGFLLNEIVPSITDTFPTDITSITFGEGHEPHVASRHVVLNLRPELDTLRTDIQKLFEKKIPPDQNHLPFFFRSSHEVGAYWKHVAGGQTINNLFLLRALIHAYQNRASTAALHDFFDAISAEIRSNAPFEEGLSRSAEFVIEEIRRAADAMGIRIGIQKHGWGRQEGNIIVFSTPHVFRRPLSDLVEKLKLTYRKTLFIDYASWRDGWGKEGLRLDQALSEHIHSPYIADDARPLKIIEANGTMRQQMHAGPLEEIAKEFDFLIDQQSEKIFVGGKSCSSKELPTQKVTADILTALLDAPNGTLTNKTLPQSTYTKYRNELTGKVLTPLKKVMRTRLKKAPLLRVHGTLYDYSVTLNARGFKIGILS